MKKMNVELRCRQTLVTGIIIVLLLIFASQSFGQRSVPTIHQPFKDFTLTSLDGNEVSISDFKGKSNVVLVTFRGWVGYW